MYGVCRPVKIIALANPYPPKPLPLEFFAEKPLPLNENPYPPMRPPKSTKNHPKPIKKQCCLPPKHVFFAALRAVFFSSENNITNYDHGD